MITIVLGKPGTGKSYHTVRYIANYLRTLAKKESIDRKIFTNLSINPDALQKYFDRRRIKIDVSDVLVLIDDRFLKYDETYLQPGEKRLEKRGNKEFLTVDPKSNAFFWNRFPDNALIVIDEIQKYLSNIKEVGDAEEQSLVEYFSLHRHKKHDWIFLTQNLMSFSISVRRVSEKIVECLNTKQLSLPFPLSIPIRDIQTLLLGFGIQNQVYRVREGRLDGSYKIIYDGPVEPVVMHKEIFDLYQTHTLLAAESASVGVSSDSEVPFDLGRGAWRRALWWFVKKHWFHLTLKFACFCLILYLLNGLFNFMKSPDWLNLLGGDSYKKNQAAAVAPKRTGRPFVPDVPDVVIDENLEEISEIIETKEPKKPIKTVVLPGVLNFDGVTLHEGMLAPSGLRVKSISPRNGVDYETPEKIYFDLYDELDRHRRWLRYYERQRVQERADVQD